MAKSPRPRVSFAEYSRDPVAVFAKAGQGRPVLIERDGKVVGKIVVKPERPVSRLTPEYMEEVRRFRERIPQHPDADAVKLVREMRDEED